MKEYYSIIKIDESLDATNRNTKKGIRKRGI